jgi:hypothetical protein
MLAAEPPVRIAVSIGNAAQCSLVQGWPLVVRVEILHANPFRQSGSILLAPPSGDWTAAIQFALAGPDGAKHPVALDPAGAVSDPRFQLAPDEAIDMDWVLSPKATAALAANDYQLTASLNLSGAAEGWAGVAASAPALVSVVVEPPVLDAVLAAAKSMAMSNYYMLTGDLAAAAAQLDDYLKADPNNYPALLDRALVFERLNDLAGAFDMVQRAIQAWYADPNAAGEAPALELERHLAAAPACTPVVPFNRAKTRNLHFTCRQIDEEQYQDALQPPLCPDLHRKEIGSHNLLPMAA